MRAPRYYLALARRQGRQLLLAVGEPSRLLGYIEAKRSQRRKRKRKRFVPPPDDGRIRLNLGGGDKRLPGYLSIDVAPSRKGVSPDVVSDIRRLAIADGCVDEVLAVHVIEHFHVWEVPAVLAEWRRVLRPGGRLALECPDLLVAAEELVARPELLEAEGKAGATTMFVFYGDPGWQDPLMSHRWGWTSKTLSKALVAAGFVDVREEVALFKQGPPRDLRVVARKPVSEASDAGAR